MDGMIRTAARWRYATAVVVEGAGFLVGVPGLMPATATKLTPCYAAVVELLLLAVLWCAGSKCWA